MAGRKWKVKGVQAGRDGHARKREGFSVANLALIAGQRFCLPPKNPRQGGLDRRARSGHKRIL